GPGDWAGTRAGGGGAAHQPERGALRRRGLHHRVHGRDHPRGER
ncbi:unnamed protein product, partial [Heterosigma akashiwo]